MIYQARVIKKYPNRRLYDTAESRYISFKDICRLAADDVPFNVVESATGRDVTRAVLLQIIADLEVGERPFLSTAMLTSIVRAHGRPGSYDPRPALEEALSSRPLGRDSPYRGLGRSRTE
jgi:polyhydroxyalkanoate synthesis repressor PhaR